MPINRPRKLEMDIYNKDVGPFFQQKYEDPFESDDDENEQIEEQIYQKSSSKPSGESSGLDQSKPISNNISLCDNFSIDPKKE